MREKENSGGSCVRVLLCSFFRLWGFLYILSGLRCVLLEYSRMIDSVDIQLTTPPLLKIPKNNEKVNFSWKYSIFFFFICKYKGPVYVSIVRGGSTMAHEIFGTNSSFPVK